MRITITKDYLSPPDFRPKSEISKQDIANRIENRLRHAGWKVDGNRATIECGTQKELSAIMETLRKIGFKSTLILDGWA